MRQTVLDSDRRSLSMVAALLLAVVGVIYSVATWSATPELIVQRPHDNDVTRLAFASDERLLFSGSSDGTYRVWDSATGAELRRSVNSGLPLADLAVRPRSHVVAVPTASGTIELHDAESSSIVRTLGSSRPGPTRRTLTLAFSPDGRVLAAGHDNGTVVLWDVDSGDLIREVTLPGRIFVREMTALPTSGPLVLLLLTLSGEVYRWNSGRGDSIEQVGTFGGARARNLAVSSDGKLLVLDSLGALQIWALVSLEKLASIRINAFPVSAVAFMSNSEEVILGGADGYLRVWNPREGTAMRMLDRADLGSVNQRPDRDGPASRIAVSANGNWVAASGRRVVRVFELPSGREVTIRRPAPAPIASLDLSGDGRLMATGGYDGVVRLWELSADRAPEILFGPKPNHQIYMVAFSPDSKSLLFSDCPSDLGILDLQSRAVKFLEKRALRCATKGVLKPSGEVAVADSTGGDASVFDPQTAVADVMVRDDGRQGLRANALSHSGKLFAVVSQGNTINIWETQSGRKVREVLTTQGRAIIALAFSPDDALLAVAEFAFPGTIILWDANSGEKLLSFAAHATPVETLVFSPDAAILASATGAIVSGQIGTKEIGFWDPKTGRSLGVITGISSTITALRFSRDGKILFAVGRDGA